MTRSDSVASGDVRLWHVPGSVGATYGTEPAHREAALIRTSPALVVVVLLAGIPLVGCGGGDSSSPTAPSATPGGATPDPTTSPTMSPTPTVGLRWQFDGSEWRATGTPPACPEPLTFTTPVDLSRVTSILYPGQSRGGDYKPHGGFRLDGPGETGVINVIAPMDATITRASRYLGVGELQYLFEFVNDCGIMYRFDHLLGLAPPLQQIVSMLPPATDGDSRTTDIPPGFTVRAGEVVATSVGFPVAGNFFFDWGVYDLRQRNTVGQSPAWQATHPGEFAAWAICWFDNLSPGDAGTVRSLPAGDGGSGPMSDYCL